ncbi:MULTISPECIES: YigZ family protein [unclassified Lentimicrobium]|uniref:IMPACT family protein n=1 Tax=unclassified Lentimicrobium TaxID=2677434 RepID=UPI001555A326|nr:MULTISPECIES: YigZ family protein [unclassified Lentimicrobium]NPD46230.1 YigZ family protein [Lentimicrobium sp. S6]NPD86280.1 YigZ family protein [Lentimicrobium sp. L6]
MLFEDIYKEINESTEGFFKDRGSKFISHSFLVKNEDEIKEHLQELRKKYYDARHHCYSWVLNPDKLAYRINDDGEPSGSAGRPIYGQLQSYDLTNILVVVIRYFGGTKLGIPGLINAYKTATKDALDQAQINILYIKDVFKVTFQYPDMNIVMKILKDEELEQFDQDFGIDCKLKFSVRKLESERVFEKFRKIHTLSIKYEKTI